MARTRPATRPRSSSRTFSRGRDLPARRFPGAQPRRRSPSPATGCRRNTAMPCSRALGQLARDRGDRHAASRAMPDATCLRTLSLTNRRSFPMTLAALRAALSRRRRRRRPGGSLAQPLLSAARHRPCRVREEDRACTNGATQRWDAFCLVTPNWQCQLPDIPYAGRSRTASW